MKTSQKTALAFAIAAMLGSAGLAYAHVGATGVVKERMDIMSSIGKSMKSITEMFQGEKPYDAGTIREAATFIGNHGSEQMTRLFPEGSIEGPTEALPKIWEDWERFSEIADDLTVFANALAAAADNPRGMSGNGMGNSGPMMGGGQSPMMGGQNPMMGGSGNRPMDDPELLATMPPDASFARLTQTCSVCHTEFRKKQ